ncbi:MAG: MATE family efflux transporter, partial [Lachnospiraceae bacterium]
MKQAMKEQLLTRKPLELLFQLSVPAVLGMIVIGLYPLMDGIFAGNIIGQNAMTACGVAAPLTFFNSGVSTLLGVGSASVLSRAIGKGDQVTVDKIMGNLIFWVLSFSAVITVSGLLLAPHFLTIVGASGEIWTLGLRYLRVIFIGSLFVNFTQSANMVMRGEGLMKKAMMIMGLGALLNIILDPILMTVMGDYAIEGAALATISAQLVQAAVTLYYFKRKSKLVRIHRIRSDRKIRTEMFAVGISAMMMQILF